MILTDNKILLKDRLSGMLSGHGEYWYQYQNNANGIYTIDSTAKMKQVDCFDARKSRIN